jgi:HEAT repeat protein
MGLLCNGKPDVRALATRQDTAGLVEAAGFQDIASDAGGTVDLGAPVREAAILALGGLGSEAVVAALADFADRVRVAAVRRLYAREAATALAETMAWLPAGAGDARPLTFKALAQLNRAESAPTLSDLRSRRLRRPVRLAAAA